MKLMPWNRPLTDEDIYKIVSRTNFSHLFQGVFSRDEILSRKTPPMPIECGVINLDTKLGSGSHWACYLKRYDVIFYIDSFGDLSPPKDFIKFFENYQIYYNFNQIQKFDTVICGHLCLCYLFNEFNRSCSL